MKCGKRILTGVLCVCLFMLLCSCAKRTEVAENEDYIYCMNADKTGIVRVAYEKSEEELLPAAGEILEELAKPAEEIDYTPALPEDLTVNDCTLAGQILTVDFGEAYYEIPHTEELVMRAAIVSSLLTLDGVRGVQILVNGESLKDKDGNEVGYLNEDDFVQNLGSSLSSYQTTTLQLFFADEEGSGLIMQTMDVKYSSNISREKLIVEKLMKGPKKNGAYPVINPDATLLSVTVEEGVCYINFDQEFLNSVYDVRPEVTIYAIVNSIVEGTTATKVQFTVNGEKDVSYMDTIDLSQPIQRDMSMVIAE